MTKLERCKKQILKEFRILQWEETITADAMCIVNLNLDKLFQLEGLPDYIDAVLWTDFKEHRRTIGKKMTPKAEELMIKALSRAKDEGANPNELLEAVILNGWQGIGNKGNHYNGIIKNANTTKYKGEYLNTSHQMQLAEKEFEDGRQHTPTSQDVGSPVMRSIQHTTNRRKTESLAR